MDRQRLVFIADDDKVDLYALTRLFSARGWMVENFANGKDLLLRIKRQGCEADLIICDIHMPQLGASEVVPLLKSCLEGHIRLVVLSSALSPEIKTQFEELKVTEIFEKPFGAEALTRFVDQLISSFEDLPS